ncbi:MAG: hypothetical protein GKR90_07795 [Pseudomonadales bacterium]|nr:hypothetical protein [Pseudomonadales bacterium]
MSGGAGLLKVVNKKRFLFAIFFSLAVHGIFLSVLRINVIELPEPAGSPELHITLYQQRQVSEIEPVALAPEEPSIAVAEPAKAPAADPHSPDPQPVREQIPFEAVEESHPKRDPAALRRSVLAAISNGVHTGAFETYGSRACIEATHLAGREPCAKSDLDVDQRGQYFAELFKQTFGAEAKDRNFDTDMDRIGRLAAERDELVALNPQDPAQIALVREQRAYIREEILRIDRSYAQFNLLKLIPIGRKVIAGIGKKVQEG